MKKKFLWIAIFSIIAIVAIIFLYNKMMAPTKVGLINYPEYLYTKIAKSSDNSFIRISQIEPDELPKDLDSYDIIIMFGMGIKLSPEGIEQIKAAIESGVDVYTQASTNPNIDFNTLIGKQLDNVSGYISNGGKKNYKNLMNYIRKEIDKKVLFTSDYAEPSEIPSDVLFHKAEDDVFESVTEYEKFLKDKNKFKDEAAKVILFTSVPGPFNANREHLNSLIDELESRNMNVYPIAGFSKRLDLLKEIKPDLIIYMAHGRLSFMTGNSDEIIDYLKELNVPMLCPLAVHQKYEDWLKDKQGMFGGLLGQSVTMPEFDGGIVPYAVFAQYEDEKGYLLFRAIPDRLTKFGQICENYLNLPKIANKDKKVAFVYFKGPGKNALVAANMEVMPSLHNTLLRLKKEGYDLTGLPDDFETFNKIVMQKGPVLGPYAEGAFDTYLESGNPELIPTDTYNKWCSESIPDSMMAEVNRRYGKAPGSYMAVYKDNKDYLAVARVQFGNVVLLPQPLPGIGEDEFALVHGAKVAPPHSYIAPYMWIQKGFKADAIFHFGTHGSLEFTPGKQIALSNYDWTDPLIGTIPHNYIYTISNVGEAMIAKRRSYTVTETYLTPPFIEAQAMSQNKIVHDKLHKYETTDGALKTEYAMSVKKIVVEKGFHRDIGLDSNMNEPYTEDEMLMLSNYLEEIEHEKVTGGLYTMGEPYSNEKLDETVLMMFVDPLARNLAEIDIQKGKINRKQLENSMFLNNRYTHPSESYIKEILRTQNAEAVFNRLVSKTDFERAEAWQNKTKSKPSGMMQMMAARKGQQSDSARLRELVILLMSKPKQKEYFAKFESREEFDKATQMLSPKSSVMIRKMADKIPAMKEALKVFDDPKFTEAIKLMQKEEIYDLAISYLKDENFEKEVAKEKAVQDSILISKAVSEEMFSLSKVTDDEIGSKKLPFFEPIRKQIEFYSDNKEYLIGLFGEDNVAVKSFLENDFEELSQKISKRLKTLETKEEIFAQAIMKIKSSLESITKKRNELAQSPDFEMKAVLNALNGGYIAPTSGGDPITNPTTVPTGRNLYAVNAEATPTAESWKVAKKLGDDLIENYKKKHGKYPKKISFTLWSSSFIQSEGTTVGQILYLLGTEPVWDPFGRVQDVRLIPTAELGRPRIDVVVQTSGQLRDIAASRLFLIDKALKLAATTEEEDNFVAKGALDAEKLLIEKGFSPKEARELSTKRVFGGVNGSYGANIMGMVESSDRWEDKSVVAKQYIQNMGAVYGGSDDWGEYNEGIFEAALLNTEAVVQPRQSNTWGALSLDHVYEFMGGINLAITEVTGKEPEGYFNDFRNTNNPRVQGLKEAIWVESRTTLLNPRYIKEFAKGGASSAENFAETFRNTFGWNVMKPEIIEDRLWDEYYDVYVEDKLNLNLHEFFEDKNPYALQEMTAVMMESVRKGYWEATPEQLEKMANLHAELVKNHEAGCSGFVCDNKKLKDFIAEQLKPKLKQQYEQEIKKVREVSTEKSKDNVVLKKENEEPIQNEKSSPKFGLNFVLILIASIIILIGMIVFIRIKRKNS